MMATGITNAEQFFYQIYGHTDESMNPGSAGRNFNNHFATLSINPDGSWNNLAEMKNSCADLSPTAGQMPRVVGLGYASKLYRENPELAGMTQFSKGGNEVVFGTIGDASTAEGHFFETMNAMLSCRYRWPWQFGMTVMGFRSPRTSRLLRRVFQRPWKDFRQEKGDQWDTDLQGQGMGLSGNGPGFCRREWSSAGRNMFRSFFMWMR